MRHNTGIIGSTTCSVHLDSYHFIRSPRVSILVRKTVLSILDNSMEINTTQHQLIVGSLLGDGHLEPGRKQNPSLVIGRSASDIMYLRWQAEILQPLLTKRGLRTYSVFDHRTNKTYHGAKIRTSCMSLLFPYYEKWYKDKVKVVPEDLELSPLILAVWLADDGSISGSKDYRRKKEYPHRFNIKFATHGFTKDEVERLSSMLNQRYSVDKFRVYKSDQHFVIRCNDTRASKLFLREIDTSFPKGMERKSDLWRKTEARLWKDKQTVPCPRCGHEKTYKNGHHGGKAWRYCLGCRRQFSH